MRIFHLFICLTATKFFFIFNKIILKSSENNCTLNCEGNISQSYDSLFLALSFLNSSFEAINKYDDGFEILFIKSNIDTPPFFILDSDFENDSSFSPFSNIKGNFQTYEKIPSFSFKTLINF